MKLAAGNDNQGQAKLRLPQSELHRFLIIGIVNTLFGYSMFALATYAGLPYPVAVAVATVAGILFNFKTIGTFVFRSHNNGLIGKFFGVYGVVYCLNVLCLHIADNFSLNHYLAQALLALPLALVGFALNRRYVFTVRS